MLFSIIYLLCHSIDFSKLITFLILYSKKEALPFFPTGPGKWHATPGDYYGCFSGNIEAFSNVRNPKQKFQKEKGNFVSSPLKQGGPGYADICINKYPTHV